MSEAVSSPAARSARRASSSGAVSSGPTPRPDLGHERSRVDALVHPDEAHAGDVVTRQDRGRDRRSTPMSRQERWVQVEGAVRQPEQRSPARSGRSPRGRSATDRAPAHRRWRRDRAGARASGSGLTPSAVDANVMGVRAGSRLRPAGRGGTVTTPTSSIEGSAANARNAGRPNPPLPMKTVRTRGPSARRLVTRGRSSPRGRRRRPRCPRRPPSVRPSTRGSRCRACRRGGRARAGAPGRAARTRRA